MEPKQPRRRLRSDRSSESLGDAKEYMHQPRGYVAPARAARSRVNNAGSCESSAGSPAPRVNNAGSCESSAGSAAPRVNNAGSCESSAGSAAPRVNNAGSCESSAGSEPKRGPESEELSDKVNLVISNRKAQIFHFNYFTFVFLERSQKRG
jgi:hypothetical protein